MRPALDITIEARTLHRRIILRGEMDIHSAPRLERTLERSVAEGTREVLLDLSGLTFMDSTGVRALLRGQEICSEHGCSYAVSRKMPVRIQELLSLTEIYDALTVA